MKKILTLAALILSFQLVNASVNQDSLLVEKAKQYIELLNQENWETAFKMYDENMKTAFPIEKLKTTWETINAQIGVLENYVDDKVVPYQGNNVVVLTCKFKIMYADLRVVYDSTDKIAGFFIAPNYQYAEYKIPAYVDIKKFDEQKMTFGHEKWELEGILSLPKKIKAVKTKMFPVVILVHGSGPNDMDESIGPNKPFKDLAWGLASKGIAVFRYNKRTNQHPEKMINLVNKMTLWDEVVEDVLFAIEKMVNQPDIDPRQIYVLGHSLGGYAIPKIYEKDNALKGLIIMAGSARPLEDLILEQYNYIFNIDNEISKEEQQELDSMEIKVAKVKNSELNENMSSDDLPLGIPASFWLDLKDYNPAESLKSCNKKILVLQGEKDYQVTMEDFKIWKESLKGKKRAVFKSYPKCSHLFMEVKGKSKPADYLKASHVEGYVIEDIVKFIKGIE